MQLGKNKTYQQLDSLFSEYIRKRAIRVIGGCERCLTQKVDIQKDNGDIFPGWKQLQCSHFIGRSKKSTRFDEDNAIGICGACHLYLTAHPLEHIEFFKARLGQDGFDLLYARSQETGRIDRAAIKLWLKQELEKIDNGVN